MASGTPATEKQKWELAAKITSNIPAILEYADKDFIQRFVEKPGEFLVPALRKVFAPILEFCIPAISHIAKSEICKKYDFRSVERDNSPTKEVILILDTFLRTGIENSISGSEYEIRLKSAAGILGLSQALWIVEHQDELPNWFMEPLGKVYVDFPATIVVLWDGRRFVPCLSQIGMRWNLDWNWLDGGFRSHGRVARSRSPVGNASK